jgi:hypothetical protein
MFSWRPITKHRFDSRIFYTFAYFVPELIPCIIQLYLSAQSRDKQEQETRFIDSLYEDNQDSIEDYKKLPVIPKYDHQQQSNENSSLLY